MLYGELVKVKSLVLGMMNFSVLFIGNKAYKSTKKGYEDYKKSILDSDRLSTREDVFFQHTVPVLVSSYKKYMERGVVFRFCVAISNELPASICEKFDELEKKHGDVFSIYKVPEDRAHSWIDIFEEEVDAICNDSKAIFNDSSLVVANFRLDDDDILSESYFESLIDYLEDSYAGFYLTFPRGYIGVYDKGYQSFYEINRPFLAIGLTRISRYNVEKAKFLDENPCIFGGVSHTKIVENCISILDSRDVSYIWTMHNHSDTRSVDKSSEHSKNKIQEFIHNGGFVEVEKGEVGRHFSSV